MPAELLDNRRIKISGLHNINQFVDDDIEIEITYKGKSNRHNTATLDNVVIPFIVKAFNKIGTVFWSVVGLKTKRVIFCTTNKAEAESYAEEIVGSVFISKSERRYERGDFIC